LSRFARPASLGPALLVAAMIALAACQPGSGILEWDPLSPEEQELRERAARIQRTVGEGAMFGALLAAALSAAVTGNVGTGIQVAGFGRLAGATAGTYVAGKQREFADRAEVIASITTDVRATNEEADALIGTMRRVIRADQERLKELRAEVAAGQTERRLLESELERARQNLEEMRRAQAGAAARYAVFATAGEMMAEPSAPRETQALEEEIAILSGLITTMGDMVADLAEDV
jgi:uncharacterized membrane protein YebE (DUF533 family)